MAEQIPELELLQLNDNLLEDNTGNKTTPTSPSIRWTDTQNDHHDLEDGIPDTLHTKEKLKEPEENHVTHIKPCEIWFASLTKSIETWLKSAGHNGGMSLNKDPDL